MKSYFSTLLLIIVLTYPNFAIEIENRPALLLDGIYTLTLSERSADGEINWTVSRILIDENDKSRSIQENNQTATGDTAQFIFTKVPGKLTYFRVYASQNDPVDSVEYQAFNRSIRQLYLFNTNSNPSKEMFVHIIVPQSLNPDTKLIMIMHGTNRTADSYVETWKSFANENDYIAIAPEFDKGNWSGSLRYNLGNMFTNSNYSQLQPKENWSFNVIQDIRREIVDGFGLQDSAYSIWGHSAGAQFIHRMMLFCPDPNIEYAIAANAGWYTAPDLEIQYPWGLQNSELDFDEEGVFDYTYRNLIIMRGTDDIIRDSNLNTHPLSDEQGRNRFERALYFYNKALEADPTTRWKLFDVQGAGHNSREMAPTAQEFLLNVTSVNNDESISPSDFVLYQNYPNPFNPITKIEYNIPARHTNLSAGVSGFTNQTHVTLNVYDMLGRLVATLVNEYKGAGRHSVDFDAASVGGGLSSGIYFYSIQAGSFTGTKKLILLK